MVKCTFPQMSTLFSEMLNLDTDIIAQSISLTQEVNSKPSANLNVDILY